jgi:hypothetical protein
MNLLVINEKNGKKCQKNVSKYLRNQIMASNQGKTIQSNTYNPRNAKIGMQQKRKKVPCKPMKKVILPSEGPKMDKI